MKRQFSDIGLHVPELLLPRADVPLESWAVVACDQYTSEPEYWEEAERLVGGNPSTLRLIVPEARLGPGFDTAIAKVNAAMARYLDDGVLRAQPPGFMLIEREVGRSAPRRGLIVALDLERFDYRSNARELIRSTEGTDSTRLPARIAVRENAVLDVPHILVLIDDPSASVIEPLFGCGLESAYDFELMQGGGRLRGWRVADAALIERVADGLRALRVGEPPLVYAMGDGNHSFAAAKSVWDGIRPTAPANHPGRHALVELVNVHDEALVFEPIHRLLDGVDPAKVLEAMVRDGFERRVFDDRTAWLRASASAGPGRGARGEREHCIPYIAGAEVGTVAVRRPSSRLATATLHAFLDPFLAAHADTGIDYIHGGDVLRALAEAPDRLGFVLPAMDKHDLFKTVVEDGATPRKTFSLGEAHEKRFYLECRRIR